MRDYFHSSFKLPWRKSCSVTFWMKVTFTSLVTNLLNGWKICSRGHHCCLPLNVNVLLNLSKSTFFFDRVIPSDVTETVGNCSIKFLEHVQVRVNLVFQRRGDLYLELIAPSGTISPLTRQRRMDNIYGYRNLTNWHITTLFSWGESPEGQWKLRIENLDENYKTNGGGIWNLML